MIIAVSCGEAHSALVTNHGHLYTVGSNSMGQLGVGDLPVNADCRAQKTSSPCLVETLKHIKVE